MFTEVFADSRDKETARYAARMYSHILLGMGAVSGARFAETIRERYLMTERRNRECARCAGKYIDTIEYFAGRGARVKYTF